MNFKAEKSYCITLKETIDLVEKKHGLDLTELRNVLEKADDNRGDNYYYSGSDKAIQQVIEKIFGAYESPDEALEIYWLRRLIEDYRRAFMREFDYGATIYRSYRFRWH